MPVNQLIRIVLYSQKQETDSNHELDRILDFVEAQRLVQINAMERIHGCHFMQILVNLVERLNSLVCSAPPCILLAETENELKLKLFN